MGNHVMLRSYRYRRIDLIFAIRVAEQHAAGVTGPVFMRAGNGAGGLHSGVVGVPISREQNRPCAIAPRASMP